MFIHKNTATLTQPCIDMVQVHTCALLADRYDSLGRSAEAVSRRAEMNEKGAELAETHEAAMVKV